MANRLEWLGQIKAVEREYFAVSFASKWFADQIRDDPTKLPVEFERRDMGNALDRLEATYLIRLFAEFEAGLRQFYSAQGKSTHPPMHDLIESLASSRRIPNDPRIAAHDVRELRNDHVHQNERPQAPITLSDCRSRLCKFFAFLPAEW